MPSVPDPTALHRAFEATHPLNWGDTALSVTEITRRHGPAATTQSLHLLEQAAAVEPAVTAQLLDSLPPGATPYQLDHRVKSPESLARKLADWRDSEAREPINDLLRYTVLTRSPDDLVAATRRTVDSLNGHDWRVHYAMHSYTDGSRYKGIHAYLDVPHSPRIEVQFHSAASAKIKDLTTPWYAIERSATATTAERAQARQLCVEASATLEPPAGIDSLTRLGGQPVAVNYYSDPRAAAAGPHIPGAAPQEPSHAMTLDRDGGIAR